MPSLPEDCVVVWLYEKLVGYRFLGCPEVVPYLSQNARVFVECRFDLTFAQPDIAVYRDFQVSHDIGKRKWQAVSPAIVVEVLYDADPHKDLVRNVDLYLQVPSIREYWLVDARYSADEPTFIVHRRRDRRWVRREYHFGETYKTKLLPGFALLIDPRR